MPKCNHIFSANDALQNHLKSKDLRDRKTFKSQEKSYQIK